jgi:hypothetical protein
MIIGRLIGFVLFVMAAIAFVRDALNWYQTGHLAFITGAEIWLAFGPDSFYGTQAYLNANAPPLWNPVLTVTLGLPAFVVALVLGFLFWIVFRRPKEQRRRRQTD